MGGAHRTRRPTLKIILRVVANQTANTLVGTSLDARPSHPMHRSVSTNTIPSSSLGRAGGARAQASRLRARWYRIGRKFSVHCSCAAGVVVGKGAAGHGGADGVEIVIGLGAHDVVRQLLSVIVRYLVRCSARLASDAATKVDRHSVSSHLSLAALPRVSIRQRSL